MSNDDENIFIVKALSFLVIMGLVIPIYNSKE